MQLHVGKGFFGCVMWYVVRCHLCSRHAPDPFVWLAHSGAFVSRDDLLMSAKDGVLRPLLFLYKKRQNRAVNLSCGNIIHARRCGSLSQLN